MTMITRTARLMALAAIAALALAGAPPTAAQTFDKAYLQALDTHLSGSYNMPYLKFMRLAEQGRTRAQFILGFQYYAGATDLLQDYAQAHIWSILATSRSSATQEDLREGAKKMRGRAAPLTRGARPCPTDGERMATG